MLQTWPELLDSRTHGLRTSGMRNSFLNSTQSVMSIELGIHSQTVCFFPAAQLRSCQEVVLYYIGAPTEGTVIITASLVPIPALMPSFQAKVAKGFAARIESRVFEARLRADFCLRSSLFHISGDSLMGKLLPLSKHSSCIPPRSCFRDEAA